MEILHADATLVVINKPAGLLSVPGRGADKQDCASARVQLQFPDALVVHRLDQATSGLLLMARGAAAQRQLSADFAARRVLKRYVALVAGQPVAGGWQLIDLPLASDWPNRPRQQVDRLAGKPSQTRWCVLQHEPHGTRVALEPLTGRTHQLRVHLASVGHPILGDILYAPTCPAHDEARLLLHASELSLPDRGLAFASPPEF